VDPDHISFVRAVSLVTDAIHDFQVLVPAQHPLLYRRLLRDLTHTLLPPRANRTNPRVVKRKMSNFKLKRAAHHGLPPLQSPFAETVQILTLAPPAEPHHILDTTAESQLLHATII
jgi:hypothetical protein